MRNIWILFAAYVADAILYVITRMYGGFAPRFLFGAFLLFALYETLALISQRRSFTVSRTQSAWRIREGEDVLITLQLYWKDRRGLPIDWLRLEEMLPPRLTVRLERPFWVAFPWRQTSVSIDYVLRDVPRGVYRFGDVTITSGDVFGILNRRSIGYAPGELVVYPKTYAISSWSALQSLRIGSRVSHSVSSDDASRVIGVRDYVPGDRLSRIHWPATARTGIMRSKEFEHYTVNELVLILDAAKDSYNEDLYSFELALSIVGSLAEYAYRVGLGFGFVAFAKDVFELPMSRGDVGLTRLLEYLAMIEPDGAAPMADSMWRLLSLPRQTTTVLVVSVITEALLGFAVIARDRQLHVELFVARTIQVEVREQEHRWADNLRALGWKIRLVRSLDDLGSLGVGGDGRAYQT